MYTNTLESHLINIKDQDNKKTEKFVKRCNRDLFIYT